VSLSRVNRLSDFSRAWAKSRIALVLCFVGMADQAAPGALININFAGAAYTGTSETSPATPGGAAGTWNTLTNGTANNAASWETDSVGVLNADGSAGPTLTFDLTSSTGAWGGNAVALQTVDYTTGVYSIAGLYESGLRNNGNATTGFRVKGLAPGSYEIFMVPMYRSAQVAGVKADALVTLSIGLGNTADARNTGDFTLTSTATNPTQHVATNLTSWTASTDGSAPYNYVGATVSIDSSSRWLTFFLGDSATSGPDRPGPSVIQIRSVNVPEASSLVLACLGALAGRALGVSRGSHWTKP
jgi:hypothetical protein